MIRDKPFANCLLVAAGAFILTDAGAFFEHRTPLVVDLDGTLIKSDLLVEAVFKRARSNPASIFALLSALRHGKAHLKDLLAQAVDLDPASFPYDEAVLGLIREALAAGRPVYLASASNARCVSAIADHFGFFSGWFGSDATTASLSSLSASAASIISATTRPTSMCGRRRNGSESGRPHG